jgi:hypothetical protein
VRPEVSLVGAHAAIHDGALDQRREPLETFRVTANAEPYHLRASGRAEGARSRQREADIDGFRSSHGVERFADYVGVLLIDFAYEAQREVQQRGLDPAQACARGSVEPVLDLASDAARGIAPCLRQFNRDEEAHPTLRPA